MYYILYLLAEAQTNVIYTIIGDYYLLPRKTIDMFNLLRNKKVTKRFFVYVHMDYISISYQL